MTAGAVCSAYNTSFCCLMTLYIVCSVSLIGCLPQDRGRWEGCTMWFRSMHLCWFCAPLTMLVVCMFLGEC
jgi:hypothetical protein